MHLSEKNKSPEQLFNERKQRVEDAVILKQPDRIPVLLSMGYMLAELGGITKKELYDNPEKCQNILEMAANRFQPDMIKGAWHTPGPSQALGDCMTQWPGYGRGENGSFQFVEKEFMKAEDYDDFLDDMSDWAIRVYTPRAFSKLEGLSALPPLGMWLFGYYNTFNFASLLSPGAAEAFEAISKAARLTAEWIKRSVESSKRLAALGFPPANYTSSMCEAPFDFMSDTLRGMHGIFIDMMRCPEKLLEAEEKVLRLQVKYIINSAKMKGVPSAFIPLHRGSDGFMSLQQFERFYWPQLKSLILQLIDNGITPWVYYEGIWDTRLKYLAELPKGKSVGLFQNSDIFKVKETIGDTMCIVGGMPISMLINSAPEQIREYTHKICEGAGKNGGFIFHTSVGELEGCNPDLVQVWIDSVKDYGVY